MRSDRHCVEIAVSGSCIAIRLLVVEFQIREDLSNIWFSNATGCVASNARSTSGGIEKGFVQQDRFEISNLRFQI